MHDEPTTALDHNLRAAGCRPGQELTDSPDRALSWGRCWVDDRDAATLAKQT